MLQQDFRFFFFFHLFELQFSCIYKCYFSANNGCLEINDLPVT